MTLERFPVVLVFEFGDQTRSAFTQKQRHADANQYSDDERDPGKPGQPALGGQARVVDDGRRPSGPQQAAAGVGGEEVWIGHLQRAGQRSGKNAQQSDEPPKEHGPHTPAGEEAYGERHMAGAEGLGETVAAPFEKRHAKAAADPGSVPV